MSYCTRHEIAFTTNASGAVTAYTALPVNGRVLAIYYDYDDADTGADFTLTGETTGIAVLTVTDAGTSDASWAPRRPTHGLDGTASLYAGSGEPVEDHVWIADERIKLVVAQGGNAKSGTLIVIVG